MARLFVFTSANNTSSDPAEDAMKFKRGMVVDILPDGMSGGREVEGPQATGLFRVIEMPGIDPSDIRISGLIKEEAAPSPGLPQSTYQRRRTWKVDLDALEAAQAQADGKALDKVSKVAANLSSVQAVMSQVAAVARVDVPVIGEDQPFKSIG